MKITKQLLEEGITQEILDMIERTKKVLPIIHDGEVVNVLRADSKSYWVYDLGSDKPRQAKKGLVTIKAEQYLAGKARYFIANKEMLFEQEYNIQLEMLSSKVEKYIIELLKRFDDIYYKANSKHKFEIFEMSKDAEAIMKSFFSNSEQRLTVTNCQKELAENPQIEKNMELIYSLYLEKNWDALYVLSCNDNMPIIASGQKTDIRFVNTIIELFKGGHIDNMLDKTALQNAAKIASLRVYA